MDIQLGGSRMEVVSSKDGNPFISLDEFTNKAQLACRIHSLDIRQFQILSSLLYYIEHKIVFFDTFQKMICPIWKNSIIKSFKQFKTFCNF